MQKHQFIENKKEYKTEKGDQTKTFSKGCKSIVGHAQPISNVLSLNEVRDIVKPKKIKVR